LLVQKTVGVKHERYTESRNGRQDPRSVDIDEIGGAFL